MMLLYAQLNESPARLAVNTILSVMFGGLRSEVRQFRRFALVVWLSLGFGFFSEANLFGQQSAPPAPSTSPQSDTIDTLLRQANILFKAGQLDAALAKAQEAGILDPKRFEPSAMAALILAEASHPVEARAALEEAVKLAPAEKQSKLKKIAQLIAAIPPQVSAPAKADEPSSLDASAAQQLAVLQAMALDASKAPTLGVREADLRILLTKSQSFVDDHPDQLKIWILRAAAAMELNDANAGRAAAIRIMGLAGESTDPKVIKVLADLQIKGWVDDQLFNGYSAKMRNTFFKAETGDSLAQFTLGWDLENGIDVEKNYVKAIEWYLKAAALGSPDAKERLNRYYCGKGVTQEYTDAINYFRTLSEQGNPTAQWQLGYIYDNCWGVAPDEAQMLALYRKSAAKENANAMYNLGDLYTARRGDIPANLSYAVELFRKSAGLGNPAAQWQMGQMYELGHDGLGQVDRDYAQALSWYRKSAVKGYIAGERDAAELLATCSDPSLRDGAKAVELAQKAVTATNRKDPYALEALAAAFAETGDFPNAISTEKEAIDRWDTNFDASTLKYRLSVYESGKPLRK